MKYQVLRDCYVGDVLYTKGEVKELPENMVKSEKNFKPVDEPPKAVEQEIAVEPEALQSKIEPVQEVTEPKPRKVRRKKKAKEE